jgi:iron complex transport system ATP-binding protein
VAPSTGSGHRADASLIEVDGVAFSYGSVAVLRDVSLRFGDGELVCVIGANGAGKSTLLRVIGGLLAPSGGSVRCFGGDPRTSPRQQLAQRLSYLPQIYQLAFPFTVSEVVLMGRYAHRSRGLLGLERQEDVDIAERAMERCDIGHLAGRRFDEISGGEQRRTLLAQAFCQRTEVVLLDEPTASLDPAHAIAVFEALRSERDERGATSIVVTHDLNLAARYGDRLILIHDELIVADGAPGDVLRSPEAGAAFGVTLHVDTLPGSSDLFVVPV